jgi:hypothetical protein
MNYSSYLNLENIEDILTGVRDKGVKLNTLDKSKRQAMMCLGLLG